MDGDVINFVAGLQETVRLNSCACLVCINVNSCDFFRNKQSRDNHNSSVDIEGLSNNNLQTCINRTSILFFFN